MKQFMKPETDDIATFNLFFDQAKRASRFLKALSHDTRLLILCLLTEGEKAVGEIELILGLPQAVVSQQLARLRQDQIVVARRDGRQVFYSLADKNVAAIMSALYEAFCRPLIAREHGA